MGIEITDNTEEVTAALESALLRALEKVGLTAEGYAKKLAPVDTGLLKNSITHAVSGQPTAIASYHADKGGESGSYSGSAPKGSSLAVYIGTNVEYAPYVELGTGAKNTPGGRPDSWGYIDDEGRAHHTSGHRAKPFLKPAAADHAQQYRKIIEDELKKG